MPNNESSEDAILNLLRTAMTKLPDSLPATGKEGLFSGGAKGKALSEQAIAEGYLRLETVIVQQGRSKKKVVRAVILDKGIQKVIQTDSPKAALEALQPAVRALSERSTPDINAFRAELDQATQSCLEAIKTAFTGLQDSVLKVIQPASTHPAVNLQVVGSALQDALNRVKPVVVPASSAPQSAEVRTDIGREIGDFVDAWVKEKAVGCAFDDLWNHLKGRHPHLTVGEFQDALRKLHDANRIRLGGWPRMLDDLPKPELALFVSSKVMYYAQPATGSH